MSPSLSMTGDRKLLMIVGGTALLIIITSILLVPGGDTSDAPSTYSAGSGGAKAAYLFLEKAGYPVRRWEQSVVDLPGHPRATFVLAQPNGFPSVEERAAVRRFMEEGGRVIAIGATGASFLPDDAVVPEALAAVTWRRLQSRSPSAVARAAPEITMAPAAYWDPKSPALPLYGDGARSRVIEYNVGSGQAVWWASATPLTNAGISEPGNLEFLLASVGDRSRLIIWDEYFHGHRHDEQSLAMAHPELDWIALQLVLVVAAVLLTYSRRSGPTMPAVVDNRQSPLEFVQTLGSLYRRAGASAVAVDITYHRFRYLLTRRLGIAIGVSTEDLDRAVRARWHVDDPAFGELLVACDAARLDAALPAHRALKLTQALSDWSVTLGLTDVSRKEH